MRPVFALGRPEVLEQLLQQAIPEGDTLAARWIADDHWTCDTSCNICLRDYGNLPYHGLLDWRLALDMARLARGDHHIDLQTDWTGRGNPWQWMLTESSAIQSTLNGLGYSEPTSFGSLRGYIHHAHHKVIIEAHSLWQDNHPALADAYNIAAGYYSDYEIGVMDPYRTIRRPSDYV